MLENLETQPKPIDCSGFEQEALRVLRDLQGTLAEVLEGLTPPMLRASQLRDALGLSQQLGWGIFTAANSRNTASLISLLPGRRGMDLFFSAAAGRGVAPEVIARGRSAFERFEESVARHAGSRDAFRSMVAVALGGEPQDAPGPGDLKHKRAAYRASAELWGKCVRVAIGTRIQFPSDKPGILDGVAIMGSVGLRRTRRVGPMQVAVGRWLTPDAGDPARPRVEPLAPDATNPDLMPLLKEFCSQPVPEFRPVAPGEAGAAHRGFELANSDLGASGEVTYFYGHISREECVVPDGSGKDVGLTRMVTIPTEVAISDILMHKSVWDQTPPSVRVYATRPDGVREFHDADLLPVTERAEYLGDGINAARTPLIPRYADMLAFAIARVGWNPDEFRVFRCKVDYPILYSRIRVSLART